jgi:hypothetical protein
LEFASPTTQQEWMLCFSRLYTSQLRIQRHHRFHFAPSHFSTLRTVGNLTTHLHPLPLPFSLVHTTSFSPKLPLFEKQTLTVFTSVTLKQNHDTMDPKQTEQKPIRENRLAKEKSPYLLQHKNNPVDW